MAPGDTVVPSRSAPIPFTLKPTIMAFDISVSPALWEHFPLRHWRRFRPRSGADRSPDGAFHFTGRQFSIRIPRRQDGGTKIERGRASDVARRADSVRNREISRVSAPVIAESKFGPESGGKVGQNVANEKSDFLASPLSLVEMFLFFPIPPQSWNG